MIVSVTQEIEAVCPRFIGALVEARVTNSQQNEELWAEMVRTGTEMRLRHTTETIKHISSIEATRRVYKACGKDPSRYRPAAEALLRRVLQGKTLYHIDTLVDLINLASMVTGYSIGGFDAEKIAGDRLTLSIGRHCEPYEGIGRGMINIEGLPVYRDAAGGVGTPTSDNERTKIELSTTRLLVLVNGYDGDRTGVMSCAEYIAQLARTYATATDLTIREY